MDISRAVMIVFNNEEATGQEREKALKMVAEGFKRQDKSTVIWAEVIKKINQDFRKPTNDVTVGYNLGLQQAIKFINETLNSYDDEN